MRASIAHAGALPSASHASSLLFAASNVARWGARASFYTLVILMPLRARLATDVRPPVDVWDEYNGFILHWSDVPLIAVLGFWLVSLLLKRRRIWLGPPLLRWTALAFLGVVWLTSAFSVDSELSAYNALRLTSAMLLALYICNEFDSLSQALPAIVLLVATQSAVALTQFVQQHGLGLDWISESPYQDPFFPGASIVWTPELDPLLRAYGLTEHPNILGGILAAGVLLLLPAVLTRRPLILGFVTAVFVAGGAALLATFSRGAMAAAALGALVMFALMLYRRFGSQAERWLIVCLLAAVLCAGIAGYYAPYLDARFNPQPATASTTESQSIDEREELIRVTVEVVEAHLLTGVGPAALPTALSLDHHDLEYTFQPVHNVFLTIAAETGLFGAGLFAALVVSPWVLVYRRRHALTPDLIASAGAVLAVTVAGVFDYYPWGLQPGRLLTWITFGLFALAYRCTPASTTSSAQTKARSTAGAVSSEAGR